MQEGFTLAPDSDPITPTTLALYSDSIFFCMAARIRGGEQGNSVTLTPIALLTALATAASGGIMGASPTPLTP